AHGRERIGVVARVGREVVDANGARALDHGQLALAHLALAEAEPGVLLRDLERLAGRGEEELAAGRSDPERPADAAGEIEELRLALVEPGGRQRAAELLEAAGRAAVRLGDGKITSE